MNTEITPILDIQNKIKCGEIFLLLNEENFIFNCLSCNESFTQIDDYMNHAKCCCLEVQCYKMNMSLKKDFDRKYENLDKDLGNTIKKEVKDENESEIVPLSPISHTVETVFINDTEFSLNDSNNRKRPKKSKSIFCDICQKHFLKKLSFEKHRSFCCSFSNDSTNISAIRQSDKMNIERKVEFREDNHRIPSLTCKFCEVDFKSNTLYLDHTCIEQTDTKSFRCEICGQCLRSYSQLKSHTDAHKGIKNFKCHLCDSAFTLSTNLKVHIRRHLGEKRFKCRYCDKRFVSTTERLIHERSHTGEKPYQCITCGKCFTNSSRLADHNRIHTGEKPHKCEQCNKCFINKKLLKDHLMVHSNDRPLSCDICNATFSRKKALQSHKKIHSDVTGYVCKICGKGFKQGPGLYSHMKSHGTILKKF